MTCHIPAPLSSICLLAVIKHALSTNVQRQTPFRILFLWWTIKGLFSPEGTEPRVWGLTHWDRIKQWTLEGACGGNHACSREPWRRWFNSTDFFPFLWLVLSHLFLDHHLILLSFMHMNMTFTGRERTLVIFLVISSHSFHNSNPGYPLAKSHWFW